MPFDALQWLCFPLHIITRFSVISTKNKSGIHTWIKRPMHVLKELHCSNTSKAFTETWMAFILAQESVQADRDDPSLPLVTAPFGHASQVCNHMLFGPWSNIFHHSWSPYAWCKNLIFFLKKWCLLHYFVLVRAFFLKKNLWKK